MPLPLHLHTAQERRPASTVPSPSQSHHVIASSRLRNLFTPNKSATFAVTVTIHSIQNVPQVQGSFSVGWKFRDAEGRGKAKVDVKGESYAFRFLRLKGMMTAELWLTNSCKHKEQSRRNFSSQRSAPVSAREETRTTFA